MASEWRCAAHGAVAPLQVADSINDEVLAMVIAQASEVPVWCPWPLPVGWTVTGVAWAGDDRTGARATALACSGPSPVGGPADVILVAEEPAVGLGSRFAGLAGPDPGPALAETIATTFAQAKVRAAGWPTPLWSVLSGEDRSVYVGEAKGLWLWAVAWPPEAGYLLAEDVILHDLTESVPSELVYGAPSPYLHGGA